MYILTSEFSFDAAHFLDGHEGKCKNIHGHRWRVKVSIGGDKLVEEGSERDMLVDFGVFKRDLKTVEDMFDHKLIFEKGTLKEDGDFLDEELLGLTFRPTAENLARNFYLVLKSMGYQVVEVTVYETPNNSVTYLACSLSDLVCTE